MHPKLPRHSTNQRDQTHKRNRFTETRAILVPADQQVMQPADQRPGHRAAGMGVIVNLWYGQANHEVKGQ